ncbi:hypothetical protein Hanom_Chr01g00064601 [Helianthus anomalus]
MFTKHHERTCNNQKYKANNASLLRKVVFKPKVNWKFYKYMCIGTQRARGLNHRLSILCKVVNVTFRHKPTCKRSLCIYS